MKPKVKVYEDYEPISNIGVCSALAIVLGVATYMGVFSNSNPTEEKTTAPASKLIQKAEQPAIQLKQKENNQKARTN